MQAVASQQGRGNPAFVFGAVPVAVSISMVLIADSAGLLFDSKAKQQESKT
nr:hypothetical protein [Comamonas testosteroni]